MEKKLELNGLKYAIDGDIAEWVTTPKDYKYTVSAETFNLNILKKLAAFHDSLYSYGKEHMRIHDVTDCYIYEELHTDANHPGLAIYEHGQDGCSQDNDCILIYTIDGVTRMTGIHACSFHEWVYKIVDTGEII
jgi:hypothetical protein